MVLRRRFYGTAPVDCLEFEHLTAVLMDYLSQEQAIVRAACGIQNRINRLLGRDEPTRPFQASFIDLFNQLQGASAQLPYLGHELEEALGLGIEVTQDGIEISDRLAASPGDDLRFRAFG
jgi:hypothetical protein